MDALDVFLPEENQRALRSHIDTLFENVARCHREPGEQSVLCACRTSQRIWDTIEGMLLGCEAIDRNLLPRALQGLDMCIAAISAMQLAAHSPTETVACVERMRRAIASRREDLNIFYKDGRVAFYDRLRKGRTA